ncbi:hypothetical protein R69608_05894 [Paraburkholderia nemoris]|nr:hypothetical protein R69608_05894 [Paraburkholderia nemoris]
MPKFDIKHTRSVLRVGFEQVTERTRTACTSHCTRMLSASSWSALVLERPSRSQLLAAR